MSSPPPWESSVSFTALICFLESVSSDTSRPRRLNKLNKFVKDCRNVANTHKEKNASNNVSSMSNVSSSDCLSSLFPVVRLLLPTLDRSRLVYGLKETNLAKLYIDFLKLGVTSLDARRLREYRVPKSRSGFGVNSDFASVLFDVLRNRAYEKQELSLLDVNKGLDALSESSLMENSTEAKKQVLMHFFKHMSAQQQKWLVRIILKDLKLGLGNDTVLKAVHPDAVALFGVNADLRNVCDTLLDVDIRLNEVSIGLFKAFKPMLADRVSIDNLEKEFRHRDHLLIETKFDGERLQVHMKDFDFKFFSRNGFDFTNEFGSTSKSGQLADHIGAALKSSVKSIILDGEVCAFDRDSNQLLRKAEQMNIRSIKSDDPKLHQCLILYDVLLLNDVVLTNRMLTERVKLLKEIVEQQPTRVLLADQKVIRSRKEAMQALNEAIDRREEGVVLKDPNSVYKPNARTKGGWIKLKPDYNEELMDNCDLIVMGGYFGSGKRSGILTHFLLGLLNNDRDQKQIEVLSLCRVGSGYTMDELAVLQTRLIPKCHRYKVTKGNLIEGNDFVLKLGKEKPDVWIEPRHSLLLQIKAAEIVLSSSYAANFTLRFPRTETARLDKNWDDAMTLKEFRTLVDDNNQRLIKSDIGRIHDEDDEDEDEGEEVPKSKRAKTRLRVLGTVGKVDKESIMITSLNLKDKVVVIEPSSQVSLKLQLETIVVQHGGSVAQNLEKGKTDYYVATVNRLRAKSVIKSGICDVIKAEWLLDCKDEFRCFRPHELLFATEETRETLKNNLDNFDDSYVHLATVSSLRHSMQRVEHLGRSIKVNKMDMAEMENDNNHYKFGLFRTLIIVVNHPVLKSNETALAFLLRFYGATVLDRLEEHLTHVVVIDDDELSSSCSSFTSRVEHLKSMRHNMRHKFHIVNSEWVDRCVSVGRRLNQDAFLL